MAPEIRTEQYPQSSMLERIRRPELAAALAVLATASVLAVSASKEAPSAYASEDIPTEPSPTPPTGPTEVTGPTGQVPQNPNTDNPAISNPGGGDVSAQEKTPLSVKAFLSGGKKAKKTEFDTYGYSDKTGRITQKNTIGDPITATYKFPFGYTCGVPSPVQVKLRYNPNNSRYAYKGLPTKRAPKFKKVFRNQPVNLKNIYLQRSYITGDPVKNSSPSVIENELVKTTKFSKRKLRPGKTKTINTTLTPEQCYSWPANIDNNMSNYLKLYTGFESPPADYPYTPMTINFHYEGTVSTRSYRPRPGAKKLKLKAELGGDLQLDRVRIAAAPQQPTQ